MGYSKHIFKIAYTFLLLFPLWAKAIGPCDHALNHTPTVGEVVKRYGLIASRGNVIYANDKELKDFWQSGWVELVHMAQENETSVSDILFQYYERQIFLSQQLAEYNENIKKFERYTDSDLESFRSSAQLLETFKPNEKFKKKHWDALKNIYILFHRLRAFVITFDTAAKDDNESASIDPFAPLNSTQVRILLDVLEEITADVTVELAVWAQEGFKSQGSPQPQTEVQAPVQIQPSQAKPLFHHTEAELSEDTNDLATVLKSKLPLQADKVYQTKTIRDQVLSIYIDKSIVRDDHGGDGQVIRRLLRSIIVGRGDKSGIKMLADLGPQIVELKAVFHGHKRIIGCLEGSKLTLKYLIDIKDSKATYSKRINPRLCL